MGDGGETDSTALKGFLDPNNTGESVLNTMKITNVECGADHGGDTSSTNNIEFQNSIQVYPNPSSGLVFVKFNFASNKDLKVQVLNVLGQSLRTFNYANARTNEATLDLSSYANGIYMIQLTDGTNTSTSKIIINK